MNQQYSGEFEGLKIAYKCYSGGNNEGCMERIEAGQDDITIFGGALLPPRTLFVTR
jgi:hypothetical protein